MGSVSSGARPTHVVALTCVCEGAGGNCIMRNFIICKFSSLNVIIMSKSKRMRWAVCIQGMVENKCIEYLVRNK